MSVFISRKICPCSACILKATTGSFIRNWNNCTFIYTYDNSNHIPFIIFIDLLVIIVITTYLNFFKVNETQNVSNSLVLWYGIRENIGVKVTVIDIQKKNWKKQKTKRVQSVTSNRNEVRIWKLMNHKLIDSLYC